MGIEKDLAEHFMKKVGFDMENDETKEILNLLTQTLKDRCGKPIYPKHNESLAVSIMTPKTAALAFDKVYRVPILNEPVPEEIGFYGATDVEMGWHSLALLYFTAFQVGIKTDRDYLFSKQKKVRSKTTGGEKDNLRFMCSEFPRIFKQTPTLFYHSEENYLQDFPLGKQEILLGALTNISMVDEQKLEWEQVLEFRNDKETRAKYIRFIRWIDNLLLTKSPEQIEDEIAIKLDDYNWTLKKHGIQTAIGTLSSLIDTKFLGSSSVATATAAITGGAIWAALTSLSLVIGKTAITFGTKYVEAEEENRKNNFEVAYIYDIKKQLK